MAVAKPKGGAGLYAKGVLDKIFRERTGKATKQVKRELLGEVAMGLIPGAGAVPKIARQKAVRGVVRGFLEHLGPKFGRRRALRVAKPQVGAVGRLPQETLDLIEDIKVERLPKDVRARYLEFSRPEEIKAARAARRKAKVTKREIWLDPLKADPGSVYHEAGHLIQRTTKDPALKKLLKPVAEEYLQAPGRGPGISSLTEKHARDLASELVSRSMWEGPGKRFTAKELDRLTRESLESVFPKSRRIP